MSRWHKHDWDFLPELAFRPRTGGAMTLEGGKGSSAPAPDPALIAAQIKSMGIQDEAIGEMLQNSRDMAPLQREQLEFGLQANRTAFDQSQADRAYTLERRGVLSGMQDKLVSDANSFDTEARRNELAGQAGADVEQAFASQRGSTARSMARMGVNPSSGRFAAMTGQMDMAQATARAGASNTARTAARTEGRAMTDRATNALAGYPAMGMQATGQGAQLAAGGLSLANQGLAGLNSGFSTGAQVAGQMGTNASNMWGQQANYKLQSDKIANDADPFATLVGAGAKLGAAYVGASDRRLKQDIVPAGKDEATGLSLYEFAYTGDPQRRFIGVMADEVEAFMPAAVMETPSGYKAVDYGMLGIEMKEVVR